MNKIDFKAFDLNLLVVFDVLMAERSVTRAAERLNRTQSAISHALSRLRERLDDPLLIKSGRRMQATPFALELIEQTRPILRGIQRALSAREPFDPAISRRVFRLGAPDFAVGLFNRLISALRAEAPGAAIEWTGPRETMLLDVAEGLTDFAIAPAALPVPDGVVASPIGELGWQCFARHDHPAFGRWGRASWSRWPHLVVRVGDQLAGPVDAAAAAVGIERRIIAWVPNFLAVAPVLAAGDLLATLPALALAAIGAHYELVAREVPFPLPPIPHVLLWSAARTNDPEVKWLRDKLLPIARDEFALSCSAADPTIGSGNRVAGREDRT
jgi:DNA-binding transcriptional LysR family regulator